MTSQSADLELFDDVLKRWRLRWLCAIPTGW